MICYNRDKDFKNVGGTVMRCSACGAPNNDDSKFCTTCGERFDTQKKDETYIEEEAVVIQEKKEYQNENQNMVSCPNCGSKQIQFITVTEGSDYDAGNGCCGLLLFGPIGLICGLVNNKKTKTTRKCMNCGKEF